ncbi:MAG: glycosyltransferase family 2 protein, partial [Methanobacterium sp.]
RAFDRKAAEVIELNWRGYGISSEIIGEMKKSNLKIGEVPIKTIYDEYSLSKGTNFFVGLKILFKLILDIFK